MGEVALSEARDDCYSQFPGRFRSSAYLDCSVDNGTGADAHGQTNHPKFRSHIFCIVREDRHHFVNYIKVKDLGDKSRSHSLNAMRTLIVSSDASLGLSNKHLLAWLDSDNLKLWFERRHAILLTPLDELADTANGTPSAYARHKDIDLAVSVAPDFRSGSLSMNLRIGFVFELLQHESISIQSLDDLLGLGQSTRHGSLLGREDHFTSKGEQHHASLHAHCLGHGQDAPVAALTGNECQCDSGIARSRFDKHGLARGD